MEVLSEKEVDQLLLAITNNASDEENTDGKVKKDNFAKSRRVCIYDFARPDKLTKPNITAIAILFEKVCKQLSKDISEILSKASKSSVEFFAHLASVDQLSMQEFIRSIPVPARLNSLKCNKDYTVYLETDPNIVFNLLSILKGDKLETQAKNRELTDEEFKVWKKIYVNNAVKILKNSANFKQLKNTETLTDGMELNTLANRDMVCLVTIEVKLRKDSDDAKPDGLLNIALPWRLVKDMTEEKSEKEPKYCVNMKALGESSVLVEGRLGTVKDSLNNISEYQVGKVIELDNLAGTDVDVVINGKVLAKAEVVVVDEKYGLRITELV